MTKGSGCQQLIFLFICQTLLFRSTRESTEWAHYSFTVSALPGDTCTLAFNLTAVHNLALLWLVFVGHDSIYSTANHHAWECQEAQLLLQLWVHELLDVIERLEVHWLGIGMHSHPEPSVGVQCPTREFQFGTGLVPIVPLEAVSFTGVTGAHESGDVLVHAMFETNFSRGELHKL